MSAENAEKIAEVPNIEATPATATRSRKSSSTSSKSVEKKASEMKYTVKDVDMSQYITVRSTYPGRLVYKSRRTGEKFNWDEIGSEQDIELRELRNMRNTDKKFFENNWIVFDEEFDWVIDFLGVRSFYNNIINTEGVDSLFKKSAPEITAEIKSMTKGQKRTVAYRAIEKISNKEIDSISVIEALEKGLGINLIER